MLVEICCTWFSDSVSLPLLSPLVGLSYAREVLSYAPKELHCGISPQFCIGSDEKTLALAGSASVCRPVRGVLI